jgi:p21-activated kinase 1
MILISTQGVPPLSDPGKWSSEFHEFVNFMLNMDPAKRPSCEQLLQNTMMTEKQYIPPKYFSLNE